jgi:histone-lysine N-methyltransferase SETMAR
MDDQNIHLRHCMLYEFNRGSAASAATRNICAAYSDGAVDDSMCYRWFAKFHSEDTTLMDKSRSRRPVEPDDKALDTLITPSQSTSNNPAISHTTQRFSHDSKSSSSCSRQSQ